MTPPPRSMPSPKKPSASPAERSAELAEVQRRLKQEAAERRSLADTTPRPPRAKPGRRG